MPNSYKNLTKSQMQLVEAIENNNDQAIKNLLDQEKNPYFVFEVTDNPIEQRIRHTLLTWAILKSESKIVKLIVENIQLAFLINLMVDGMTPLARHSSVSVLQF